MDWMDGLLEGEKIDYLFDHQEGTSNSVQLSVIYHRCLNSSKIRSDRTKRRNKEKERTDIWIKLPQL